MDGANLADWLQFGALGLIVISIIAGWLVPGRSYDREVARADRLEEENQRIRDRVEDKVVPLVERAIIALEREADYHYTPRQVARDADRSSRDDDHDGG